MQIIKCTSNILVLQATRKDHNFKSFIFDIGIIPLKPTPKIIQIQVSYGKTWQIWKMSWKKFLKQTCIDNIIIVKKSEFVSTVVQKKSEMK